MKTDVTIRQVLGDGQRDNGEAAERESRCSPVAKGNKSLASSQVRKVGLPPLFRNYLSHKFMTQSVATPQLNNGSGYTSGLELRNEERGQAHLPYLRGSKGFSLILTLLEANVLSSSQKCHKH
jgi:hypothetical protein